MHRPDGSSGTASLVITPSKSGAHPLTFLRDLNGEPCFALPSLQSSVRQQTTREPVPSSPDMLDYASRTLESSIPVMQTTAIGT